MQNVPVQNIPVHPQNPQIYSYPVYEVPKKNADIFSILSLVFGILGTQIAALFFIFSPLAIIFGIIGRKKSKSGMALAGIIIGAITFTILILYIVISVIGYATTDTLDFFNDGLYF